MWLADAGECLSLYCVCGKELPFPLGMLSHYIILACCLPLHLLTGYKMYPGLEFSWTFLAGTEKQSYQFFYLFVEVPLTQHNRHSAHILFFTCALFFQIQLNHFVPVLVKNVSNTYSAKTYYINRLTHKNCKRVTTSNPTAHLTD
jgi:hypothetical protein